MKRRRETLEDVIRMATRVQARLAKEGIGLHWTITFGPLAPKKQQKGQL